LYRKEKENCRYGRILSSYFFYHDKPYQDSYLTKAI